MSKGVAIVLPARYGSTRFPGKPLALIAGRPLIRWVYERAQLVGGASRVIVATDHDGIADVVRGFGGEVSITASGHRTGTDRVAEVARSLDDEVIVNLQGDEPIFSVDLVEEMVRQMRSDTETDIVTACHPITDVEQIGSPHVVKVVMNRRHEALYFSRSPIPSNHSGGQEAVCYRHVGIYVFRRDSLLRFADTPPTPLERAENLEQLRALEVGMKITLVISHESTVGVDIPEDIKSVEKAMTTA